MGSPWSVSSYSIEELRRLLGVASTAAWPESCVHDRYFEDYFLYLRARAMLVEHDYVDHDFIEDFAAYYVRCFKDYGRKCTRLHFFNREVSAQTIEQALEQEGSDAVGELQAAYLGFVVVRPIPQRCIGRTCLVTYPRSGGRHYTNLREYKAHPFGFGLSVTSLAFQQQDQIVAECATSALWSALQATGKIFDHHIPSPAEITHAATRRVPLETRTFPTSAGLSVEQMADAIRTYELEPLVVGANWGRHFRAAMYGYAGAGIPVIVVGEIVSKSNPSEVHGQHAVTLTGHHVDASAPSRARFRSDLIDKVYAHDDAVGPFARMQFTTALDDAPLLTTSIAASKDDIGTLFFRPIVALIPLYHKVRISFERVWQEIMTIDAYLAGMNGEDATNALPALQWDVRLTTVNEYKGDIRRRAAVEGRRAVLEHAMPRFLWLARALQEDGRGLDLLFDATGIAGDELCFLRVDHGSDVSTTLRNAGIEPSVFPGAEATAQKLLAARA